MSQLNIFGSRSKLSSAKHNCHTTVAFPHIASMFVLPATVRILIVLDHLAYIVSLNPNIILN
jgi:hypothetical protein